MDRSALEARYASSLATALAESGTRARPRWMQPRLPAAIGASMLAAQELLGETPEALAAHYLDRAPRELVEQQLRGDDAARGLLWRPLVRARLPAFSTAVDRACDLLRESGLDPARVIGAAGSAELLEGDPCAVQLLQPVLLASGLPFLGAGTAERGVIARGIEAGGDLDQLLDRHLGQHLLHELLHGRAPDRTAPYDLHGPPWFVREAAALWLQSRAFPRHIFPEAAGEAVPGVSLFVLAGEGLARALGVPALLSSLDLPGAWRASVPAQTADALASAEWQEWLPRKDAPFARDALRAEAWVKLAFLAREPNEAFAQLLDRCSSMGVFSAAKTLPPLLDAAERVSWGELAWWREEIDAEEIRGVEIGLRALFQENAMAPIFVTRPSAIPGGRILIDVEACRIEAAKRATGVFAEPARWTLSPPVCRALHQRGIRKIELRGARRDEAAMLAAALVAVARDRGPSQAELMFDAGELAKQAREVHARELDSEEARGGSEERWTSSPE